MKKTMKMMAMVLFVLGMTALTSCTKSNENLILGQWKLETVSVTVDGQTETMTLDQIAAMLGAMGGEDVELEEVIIEFKDDGYFYLVGGTEKAPYTVDGDKLIIEEGDEAVEVNIKTLTSSTLTLEATEEDDGEVFEYAVTFKKV